MAPKAAVVFTYKSVERILMDGGTQSWRMHESHFGQFDYVICARNALHKHPPSEGSEPHKSAFLIGRVKDIVPSTDPEVIAEVAAGESKPRFLIRMTEAALLPLIPDFWKWGRWPAHYDDLDALGIDLSGLDFKPLPKMLENLFREKPPISAPTVKAPAQAASPVRPWRDIIESTRLGLSAQLGIDPSAIEITIRM